MKQMLRYVVPMLLFCSTTHAQTNFWQQTAGPDGRYVSSLVTNASGHVFAVTDSGMFRSTDDGASWTRIRSPYSYSMAIDSDDRVFAISRDSNRVFVFRSTDNGDTWNRLGNGWQLGNFIFWGVSNGRVVTSSLNQLFVALDYYAYDDCGGASIWHSTDHGLTWDSLAEWSSQGFSAVGVDRADRIFASVGCAWYGASSHQVFRSEDFGATWSLANSGLPESWRMSLAFSSSNDAYVGTWFDTLSTIYCSTNNGYTWSVRDTVGGYISAMLFDGSDNLFVATYGHGVYRNGIQMNSGLSDLNVTSLASSSSGYLYAGTYTGGVFRSVLPTVAVQELSGGQPSSFVLHQNYPNPFNPTTHFGFRIAKFGFVSLKVYDVLGREVATLVNEVKQPGTYTLRWGASGMASGVYFYCLQVYPAAVGAGSFVQTRRMILMK